MTPAQPPRVLYHLLIQTSNGRKVPVVLEAAAVYAWVTGYATALGEQHHLNVIEAGPEETRRVQALQIGDAQGWFEYLYPEYPDRTEG